MKYNPKIAVAYFVQSGLPRPEIEFQFLKTRKWRFDFAWPQRGIALEVEGGIWTGGRHSRGAGMAKDMEKYNTAALRGWMVLRVQPIDLCLLSTVQMLKAAMLVHRIPVLLS